MLPETTSELLRRLAAHDEQSLEAVLSMHHSGGSPLGTITLERSTRVLVELAALLVADASTTSVRWAVERAAATGIDVEKLVGVLLTAASAAGAAQTVTGAPRLALALDYDVEVDGWAGD